MQLNTVLSPSAGCYFHEHSDGSRMESTSNHTRAHRVDQMVSVPDHPMQDSIRQNDPQKIWGNERRQPFQKQNISSDNIGQNPQVTQQSAIQLFGEAKLAFTIQIE